MTGEKEKGVILAGAAVENISPATLRSKVWLAGYQPSRFATEKADPIQARALALGDETNGALIVSADVCLFTPLQTGALARTISRRIHLPPENIFVTATHTHSGPDVSWVFGGVPIPYFIKIRAGIISAAIRAWESRRPSTPFVGTGTHELGIPRRAGKDQTERDHTFVTLQFRSGGEVVSTLINLGCHGVVLPRTSTLLSADLPGAICRGVDSALGGVSLFMPRIQGDVNPNIPAEDIYNQNGTWDDLERLAAQGVELVKKTCDGGQGTRAHPIRVRTRVLDLKVRELSKLLMLSPPWTGRLSAGLDIVSIPFRRFELGELRGFAVPGEVLTDLGLRMLGGLGRKGLLFSYCGGYYGYLMCADSYNRGGYEPGVSPGPIDPDLLLRLFE